MPRPLNTELRIGPADNRVTVGDETRYLMGSAEGPWWFKFSWWVIPLGLILVFGPWFLVLGGRRNPSHNPVPAIHQPAPATPVVVSHQPPQPAPAVPTTTPRWSSRDECEYYYIVERHEAPVGRCN